MNCAYVRGDAHVHDDMREEMAAMPRDDEEMTDREDNGAAQCVRSRKPPSTVMFIESAVKVGASAFREIKEKEDKPARRCARRGPSGAPC